MAKVLLINPPAEQTLVGNNPKFLDEARGYNPPLGLLYLAAMLDERSEHAVCVIDAQAEELSYERLAEHVAGEAPDLVGITAMTFTLLDVVRTVAVVRQAAPEAKVVLGGPHVHLYPRECVALPGVDFAITGEGEHSIVALADRLHEPNRWDEVPGLVYRNGSRTRAIETESDIVVNEPRGPIEDLDSLPFPARDLVPFRRYSSVLARRQPITTMFTSRGCPYRCTFCDRPHLGKKFRAHSPKYVVDEMQGCVEMGIHEFLIYDDTFTVRRQRVLDICAEIQRRGLDVGWDIRARVDTVDEEMLKALRAAGCERIHYGVEAGSDRFMQVLNKGITVEDARKAFRLTKRAGISTLAYFMIGIPGQTEADVRQTFRLARQLDPDVVHITILTPFPGTEIYRQALEQGVYDRDHWLDFAREPRPGFQPLYWTRELGRERLEELLVAAYKSFYVRPRYILRQLLKCRSWRELTTKVKAGLRVALLRKR
ncbi:MAG TPA: radical SAM protein [Planctomycetota bacterium]|nr:radical SAM protein [Planctomycetota bacterium]